jgi:UDP-GlcNAc:undecaprenyl-phosphate GlcNAc-1-phosphate transferase
MLTYLVAFSLAFAVAAALTPVLRALAPVIGGIDLAVSSRKVHLTPTPRIGGVAIVAGFFVPLVGLFFYTNDVSSLFLHDRSLVVGLFVGGTSIAALGFYDDLHGAGAKLKFLVQFLVAFLVFKLGFRIDNIANPFGALPFSLVHFHIPFTVTELNLSMPFTLLWIVGVINAMNLIDGLDGLAGGVSLISIGLLFAVAFNRPEVLMCLFMASLGGAVMGFLLYNFNPATIFMGDTGSMFLGFVLATSSIVSSQKSSAVVAMLVPIVSLGLPIVDTLLAMMRRAVRGRPLFSADKEHIHHKLLALGLTHRQAVLTLYGVCLFLALVAFGLASASSRQVGILLAALGLVTILSLRRLGYLHVDAASLKQNAESRERNQGLRGAVKLAGAQFKAAPDFDGVWAAVTTIAPVLAAREMTLALVLREQGDVQVRQVLTWRDPQSHATTRASESCVVKLDLQGRPTAGSPGGRFFGSIVIAWADGRVEVRRDDEIALEMLVDHLEDALERIEEMPPLQQGDEAELLPVRAAVGQVVELRRRR